jgi:hypothetical protein
MKGKFLLRIYKHHDQDLIYLYTHPNFDFHKFVRQCLLNYFSDEKPFWAKMPEEIPMTYDASVKGIHEVTLTLTNAIYENVWVGLTQVRRGYRNAFVKGVIRNYICFANFSFYFHADVKNKVTKQDGRPVYSFYKEKNQYSNKNMNLGKLLKEEQNKEQIEYIELRKPVTKKKKPNINKKEPQPLVDSEDAISSFLSQKEAYLKKNDEDSFFQSESDIGEMRAAEGIQNNSDTVQTNDPFFDMFSNMLNNF